jgi:hypothetical protein
MGSSIQWTGELKRIVGSQNGVLDTERPASPPLVGPDILELARWENEGGASVRQGAEQNLKRFPAAIIG